MRFPRVCMAMCVALLPVAAKADSFKFTVTAPGGGFSGTGVLNAVSSGGGIFTINGISGSGITGLIGPSAGSNDNLLFPSGARLLDVNGFSFTGLIGGVSSTVNIFSTASGYEEFAYDNAGGFYDNAVTFSAAAVTPEPSGLVLLGSGVLSLAGAAVRRRVS